MLLSIIIVSYNTAQLTLDAVKSVLEEVTSSTLLQKSTEVIVIDNNSSDESVAQLQKRAKSSQIPLKVIENKANTGFAAANNQGIELALGTFIVLLNSDTVVLPHALERLVIEMQDHPVNEMSSEMVSQHGGLDRLGILAASLLNPDRSSQPQGGSFPTLFSLASHMLMLDDLPLIGRFLPSTQHTGRRTPAADFGQTLHQQDWVGGTAMLIRKTVVEEIGNLDENIFMYGEDVEFCLRAKQHHWDIAVHSGAQIVHYGMASGSSLNATLGELKGYLYIWSKHKPSWQIPIVKSLIKIGMLCRVLIFGTMNHPKAKVYREVVRELHNYV